VEIDGCGAGTIVIGDVVTVGLQSSSDVRRASGAACGIGSSAAL